MRFERLVLRRYGAFLERTLDFAPGARQPERPRPNGAGKSTTLAALRSALFGITAKEGAFRYAPATRRLEVALVREDGERIEFQRRSSPTQPLWSVDDAEPLDAAALLPFLGGLDRGTYTRLFGLDQEELRTGGEDLVEQRAELGQALFSAALGAERLAHVRDALGGELAALHTPGSRSRARVAALTREHGELRRRRREAEFSQGALKKALDATGRPYTINEGDGAFYGPKIDFDVYDALERSHQCATVQLDYQLPRRFDLSYVGADNQPHVPVVIHRAVFGSFERCIAILIEHFGGNFPVWLAPTQVKILPVSDAFNDYGQTVLVTGASSGIGEAMARQLAFQQARLLLTARSEDKLNALADEFRRAGAEVDVLAHDLGEAGATQTLYDRITEAGHEVDVLINNAGFGYVGAFAQQDAASVEGMATLNMTNLTVLTRLFLPAMLARGRGGVRNVASTASYQPIPLMSVYAATKAYVRSFSEALAAEVGGTGVAVTCLCPGPTATAFADEAGMNAKFFRVAEPPETVAAVGLAATACGDDGETITLYSGRGERLIQPIIDRFEEESGINVEVNYGDNAELALLLQEADAGRIVGQI